MDYNTFSRKGAIGEDWKLVDQFNSAYWSGQDVKIYFNDVLIEDGIQINYQIAEQARPYYGYASYIPQRIYHGARIVAGEFSLNFKRDGYIFSLINYLTNGPAGQNPTPVGQSAEEILGNQPLPFLTEQGELLADDIKSLTPDQLSSRVKAIKAGRIGVKNSLLGNDNSYPAVVRRDRGVFQTTTYGFDIKIIYGANLTTSRSLRFESTGEFYSDGATHRNPADENDNNTNVNCTGIKLIGASIMGQAKSINDSGQPFIETYTFQARDVQVMNPAEIKGVDQTTLAERYQNDMKSDIPGWRKPPQGTVKF